VEILTCITISVQKSSSSWFFILLALHPEGRSLRDLVPSGGQSCAGWGFALGRFAFGGVECQSGPGLEKGRRRGVDFDCGFGGGGLHGGLGWGGVVGDFADHFVFVEVEADAAGIFYGDVESAEHELGSAEVDSVAGEGVDDFHERSLDGLLVFPAPLVPT
jgi:hypothetical protein